MNRQQLSEADHVSGLFFKKLVGSITADEQAELDRWAAQGDRRREYAELLASAHYLQEEYQRQKAIDARRAMRQMQQRIAAGQSQAVPKWRRWAVAATVALLVAAGGLVWWRQYTKVVPPTVSEEVRLAMAQSKQSGHDAADIVSGTVEDLAADIHGLTRTDLASDEHGLSRTGHSANPAQQKSVSVRVSPMQKEDSEAVRQLLAARRVTTRSDKEYWLTLPDGSLVHLNYNTHVIYPEQFTGPTRDVILDGEAYFMVARDRRHPFIVHTPQGDVKEYGTEFNVNTRGEFSGKWKEESGKRNDFVTEVVLVEGSISVIPTNGKEQMMKPGEMAQLSTVNCQLSTTDVSPYVAWNTGDFMFTDQPLEKVMDVMARWYGRSVEYTSDEIPAMRVSGAVGRYNSVGDTMEAIEMVTGLRIAIKPDRFIISN